MSDHDAAAAAMLAELEEARAKRDAARDVAAAALEEFRALERDYSRLSFALIDLEDAAGCREHVPVPSAT